MRRKQITGADLLSELHSYNGNDKRYSESKVTEAAKAVDNGNYQESETAAEYAMKKLKAHYGVEDQDNNEDIAQLAQSGLQKLEQYYGTRNQMSSVNTIQSGIQEGQNRYFNEDSELPTSGRIIQTMDDRAIEEALKIAKGRMKQSDEAYAEKFGRSPEAAIEHSRQAAQIDRYQNELDSRNAEREQNTYYKKREDALNALTDEQRSNLEEYVNATREMNNTSKISGAMGGTSMITENLQNEAIDKKNAAKKALEDSGIRNLDVLAQYMGEIQDEENTVRINDSIKKDVDKHPVLAGTAYSALDVAMSPAAGLTAAVETLKRPYYADPSAPVNTNSDAYALTNFSNATESAVSDKIDNKYGQFAYGVGMSTAKSAYSVALGSEIVGGLGLTGKAAKTVGNIVTLPEFGASAYATTLQQDQANGVSTENSIKHATAAGINEMLFEVVSLDHAWDILHRSGKTAAKEAIVSTLAQAGIEGTEEGFTDIANAIADNIINGDQSEYNRNVQNYVSLGYTEQEAKDMASKDFMGEIAQDVLAGAISGGIMGGITNTANAVNYHKLGEHIETTTELKNNVLDVAEQMDESTTAKQIVEEKGRENLNAEDLGAIAQSMAEESGKDIQDVLAERFAELGETNQQARKDAKEIIKAVTTPSEEVTNEENDTRTQKFEANPNLSTVYAETLEGKHTAVNDAINNVQSSYHYAQMEKKGRESHTGVTRAVVKSTGEKQIVIDVQNVSGNHATVRMSNGTLKDLSEIEIPDRNLRQLYNFSTTMDTATVANTLINNWDNEEVAPYVRASAVFYNAGKLGTSSFESLMNNPKNAQLVMSVNNPATLKAMYTLGQNNSQRAEVAPVQQQKNVNVSEQTEKTERAGKVVDLRTDKADGRMAEVAERVAKKTGLEITLNDSLEHGENGHFSQALSRIALSSTSHNEYETLIHELNEWANTYNPEGMRKVMDAVLGYAQTKEGATYLSDRIQQYYDTYKRVESDKTYEGSADEFVFDYLAGVFSSEEGVKDFSRYMTEENISQKEQKSILETVADFFKELYDKIVSFLDDHVLSETAKKGLKMDAITAQEIRDNIFDVWSEAKRRSESDIIENDKYSISIKPDYLEEKMEDLADFIEKKYGLETYHDKSRISDYSNYIELSNDDGETLAKIRVSDHTNNEIHDEALDIRINDGRKWSDVKKEILSFVNDFMEQHDTDTFVDDGDWNYDGEPAYYDYDLWYTHGRDEHEKFIFKNRNKNIDVKYSFGGIGALNADRNGLSKAIELESRNESEEKILKETGWFRGADHKWRFEIDDSKAAVFINGDAKLSSDPEYQKFKQLSMNGDFFDEDYARLSEKYAGKMKKGIMVGDYLDHQDLFDNYPALERIFLKHKKFENGTNGSYEPDINTIFLNEDLFDAHRERNLKKTLLHELQHIIQHSERFARGGSLRTWTDIEIRKNQKKFQEAEETYKNVFKNGSDEFKNLIRTLNRLSLDGDFGEEYTRVENELYDKYEDMYNAYDSALFEARLYSGSEYLSDREKYLMTAGEIEARDVSSRAELTADERRNKMPVRETENGVIFAENKQNPFKYREESGNKYSINVDFRNDVDKWFNNKEESNRKKSFFIVGTTSEVLKKIGVKDTTITWDKSKIKKILNDHKEMTIDIIKDVPNVLENPIVVMQSKTRFNSITLLGEVYANGEPVMVAMQLRPEGKGGRLLNYVKISSAYVRNNIQNLIDTSELLYIDNNKKRTNNWLSACGLQLPLGLTNYGLLNKITYYTTNVKDEINKNAFTDALERAKLKDIHYSIDIDDSFFDTLYNEPSEHEAEMSSIIQEGFESLKNVEVNERMMHKIAYAIKKENKSTYDIDKLTSNLTKVFAYLKEHQNADYNDMVRIVQEVAKPVIEESTDVDPYEQQAYKDVRDYVKGLDIRLNDEQKAEVAYYYGSYEKFRKMNFGNFNFTDKGTYLDNLWTEIVDNSYQMLDYDVSSADQPMALVDMLNQLKPAKKNIFGMDKEQAAYDLALDIYRRFFVEQAQDAANKKVYEKTDRLIVRQQEYRKRVKAAYDESLAKLRTAETEKRKQQAERYEEKIADLKSAQQAALANADKKAAKKYQDDIVSWNRWLTRATQRADRTEQRMLELKAATRNNALAKRRNQEMSSMRERIKKNANGIISYFNTNTDKKHVPEALKDSVAKFITSIDFVSERANPDSNATMAWRESLNQMYRKLSDRNAAVEGNYEDIFNALMDQADGNKSTLLSDMSDFINANENVRITDMNANQLKQLDELITRLKRTITTVNQLYVNKRTNDARRLGADTIAELDQKKDKKLHANRTVQAVENLLDVNMMDARSYFYRLGDTAGSIYDALRTAFNDRVWLLKEAQTYMENALEGINTKDWTGDNAKVHTFMIRGKELQMTTAQIMSLYELRKRNQALLHMKVGGVRPKDITTAKKNVDISNSKFGKEVISRVKPIKLTEYDIDHVICSVLTPEQIKIADAMQQFMANNCADWGNKTTMMMNGYKRFGVKSYFPIKVDGNSVDTKDQTAYWATQNNSFTKQTRERAANALIVDDIFDVFTKHVTDMATYSTFTAPLSDAMKWFNHRNVEFDGDIAADTDSVQRQIELTYGKEYLEYFKKLIKDINAESVNGIESQIASTLVSKMKAASVGGNLRVAIQQPTAYIRAAAVMNPKYMAQAVFKKSAMKKAKENSAITQWKSWGYFETSIGQSMKSVITGQQSLKENIVEKSMILAQLGDDVTWGYLWNACEAEIKDKHPDVKYDSKEFIKMVADRFDEIVDQTQVVDSVLHRSQIMRSQDKLVQMATSFMAEPTKSYNLLVNAVRDASEKKSKSAMKRLGRVVTAYTATQVMNAAIVAVIDAARDLEDDDKTFWDKYIENLKGNIGDNMNPISMIPFAKDIVSIFQGYDISRLDMQGISKLYAGANNMRKYITDPDYREKHTFYDVAKETARGVSLVTGIPGFNVLRDIESLYHAVTGKWLGGIIRSNTRQYQRSVDALLDGNTEEYNSIMQELSDKNVEEDKIDSGIMSELKKRYTAGEIEKSTVENILKDQFEMDDNDIYYKLKKWENGSDWTKYSDFYSAMDNAYETGKINDRDKIKAEIDDLKKHGVKEENIKSQITEKYKPIYLEAKKKGNYADLKNLLISAYMMCGDSHSEAMKKIDNWSKQKKS